jgi:hypothetical protein
MVPIKTQTGPRFDTEDTSKNGGGGGGGGVGQLN